MSKYPRELSATEIAPELEALVRDVAHRLLNGPTPQHRILREQLVASRVDRVTLTGAGLFADLSAPSTAPRVEPPDMIGGEVLMNVDGLDAPAGSLVKVIGGRLAFVEIYTYGNVGWPDRPRILAFGDSMPLPIPMQAT